MTNSFFGFTSSVMKGSMKARSPTTPWAWASTAVIAQRNPPTALARHRIMYPSRPAAQRRDPSRVGWLAVAYDSLGGSPGGAGTKSEHSVGALASDGPQMITG